MSTTACCVTLLAFPTDRGPHGTMTAALSNYCCSIVELGLYAGQTTTGRSACCGMQSIKDAIQRHIVLLNGLAVDVVLVALIESPKAVDGGGQVEVGVVNGH